MQGGDLGARRGTPRHRPLLRRQVPRTAVRRLARRAARAPATSTPTSRWCRTRSAASPRRRSCPIAEHVHRDNGDVPEEIIAGLAEMGAFGLVDPGGVRRVREGGEGEYIGMVVATEELSRGSLGVGGSLITRPEILTRAAGQGGTEEQKHALAAQAGHGRGDGRRRRHRARLRLRRRRHQGHRHRRRPTAAGYVINGVKTWCTFGARADVLMLLARTDPDRSKAHRGLSLFIVPKPRGEGHGFEFAQRPATTAAAARWRAARSTRSATAACTPTRSPSTTGSCRPSNLIGEDGGSARASTTRWPASRTAGCRPRRGPSASCRRPTRRREYAQDRMVFGKPIADYQLTRPSSAAWPWSSRPPASSPTHVAR